MVRERHAQELRGIQLGHLLTRRVAQVDRLEQVHVSQLSARDPVHEHSVELGDDREMGQHLVGVPLGLIALPRADVRTNFSEPVGNALQPIRQQVSLTVTIGGHERLDVVHRESRALDLHRNPD